MTTFGEIVEPSSRTAWEDWDEIGCNENYPVLHLDNDLDRPAAINNFIILEGRYLYDYMKGETDLVYVNSIPEVNLRLYRTKEMNNYVCVIKDYNLVLSSEIVELLKDYITKSTDVVSLLTKPLVEYQVSNPVHGDFIIRSINTSKQTTRSQNLNFPHLEQPNIISGFSAGVLSWREVNDLSAVAIICYLEHPEEPLIPELQHLLEQYQVIPQGIRTNRCSLLSSNLYI